MPRLHLEHVDSTNHYCKENLNNLCDKMVVTAKNQTAGRGRFARNWVDLGEGNLFLSIVLKPANRFQPVYSNLTQYLSVVLCHVLEKYGMQPEIKWPNDVLIEGKKIAGILSETVMQGNDFRGLVLGIGVNLRANSEDLTKIPDKVVTALNIEHGENVDCEIFLKCLLEEFFLCYDEFIENGFSFIRSDYLGYANFINKEVCVQVLNETKSGIVKTVDDDGALLLEKDDQELVLTIGDIL